MKKMDSLLEKLGHIARQDETPAVDVRMRVIRTLETYPQRRSPQGTFPAFAVVGFATVVLAFFIMQPAWMGIVDPWSYLLSY